VRRLRPMRRCDSHGDRRRTKACRRNVARRVQPRSKLPRCLVRALQWDNRVTRGPGQERRASRHLIRRNAPAARKCIRLHRTARDSRKAAAKLRRWDAAVVRGLPITAAVLR
jgi:hypothetical protein